MSDAPTIAVLIPALNEAESLRSVLPALQRAISLIVERVEFRVFLLDNGSNDETARVAAGEGVTVVSEPRRGYGAACAAGVAHLASLPRPPQAVVFFDADGSDDPAFLSRLLVPILTDQADLVIGCRDRALRERGSLTPPQAFGTWLAVTLIRLIWGFRYRDLGPFRVIRFSSLRAIDMRDRAYGWTVEMQVRAVQLGLRIEQIGVPYRRRKSGRSKISGTVSGVARAGYWILTTIARLAVAGRGGRGNDRRGGGSRAP